MTDILQSAEADAGKIVVTVENVFHTVEIDVEKGWTWVEGEFVRLKAEAEKVYAWVKAEDPLFAALVRQQMLIWETDAANLATAEAGALGRFVTTGASEIETTVANFVQGVLGGTTGGTLAKEGVLVLINQGETALLAAVKAALPKVLAALLPAA